MTHMTRTILLLSRSCALETPLCKCSRTVVRFSQITKSKGKFLYSTVSGPWVRSKRVTLHPLAHLLTPTPTRLLREAFNHAATTARRLPGTNSFIFPMSVTRYSLIQPSKLMQRGLNETARASKQQKIDENPGHID